VHLVSFYYKNGNEIEFPYNVCNCILSGGRVSNLELEGVCSQTLIPTC